MRYSIYQTNIFDEIINGTTSIVIEAVAGSGKSTTIVEAANRLPKNSSVLFLAFNKSIVEELKNKLPSNIICQTFNSLGWQAWRRFIGKNVINISSNKVAALISEKFTKDDERDYATFVRKMISFAKSHGLTDESSDEDWINIMERHDVALDEREEEDNMQEVTLKRGLHLCKKTLVFSNKMANMICDFDDQIYMPWISKAPFTKYDYIFIDEAQDTNFVQKELLTRMLKPHGRLIAVGDSCQAIYGFRGADNGSMAQISDTFRAITMPLSVSYRCAKNIVVAAQEYNPNIECFEHAPDGIVEHKDNYSASEFTAKDAVICRFNAPLLKFAYGMLKRRKPINFVGRDLMSGLHNLIKLMKATNVGDLDDKLDAYLSKQVERLSAKNNEKKIESLTDQVNCIKVFTEDLNANDSIRIVMDNMANVFREDTSGVTLTSIHRSKGREWDKVYLLDFGNAIRSSQDWQKEQENNLCYVAITRAKSELYYILTNKFSDKD